MFHMNSWHEYVIIQIGWCNCIMATFSCISFWHKLCSLWFNDMWVLHRIILNYSSNKMVTQCDYLQRAIVPWLKDQSLCQSVLGARDWTPNCLGGKATGVWMGPNKRLVPQMAVWSMQSAYVSIYLTAFKQCICLLQRDQLSMQNWMK